MQTVRRGYWFAPWDPKPKRVLIDDLGFVFYSGSGWSHGSREGRIITLPGDLPLTVNNWWDPGTERLTDWAWIYSMSDLSTSLRAPKKNRNNIP